MVSGTNSGVSNNDYVFRDPWRNPYVITVDANRDQKCRDAFYSQSSVSRQNGRIGFNGLINNRDASGVTDEFEFGGSVMVWSLGPDGQADPSVRADQAPNRDNILSWQ